jgi:hypothetical protein
MARVFVAIMGVLALVAVGCGGDDDAAEDSSGGAATTEPAPDESGEPESERDEASEPEPAPEEAAPAGTGGGSMVLGEETISFDSARCFLQEQDAAAGGGKILFVAQAFGENAEGEEVLIDVSRYDEDSQFYGDDILLTVGDPFSAEAANYFARGEVGIVTVDGNSVSAGSLEFTNDSDFTAQPGSLQINC